MSHHDHDHHDHHGHHHSHHGHEKSESHGALSEADKLTKIVEHWIRHNEEHAKSYRDWADRARDMGREEVYMILDEVATGTQAQSKNLEKALALLKGVS